MIDVTELVRSKDGWAYFWDSCFWVLAWNLGRWHERYLIKRREEKAILERHYRAQEEVHFYLDE